VTGKNIQGMIHELRPIVLVQAEVGRRIAKLAGPNKRVIGKTVGYVVL
jgi:hypothetical protein